MGSTPSLKSRLMALQMGFKHKKELPCRWRRSTGGYGTAPCKKSNQKKKTGKGRGDKEKKCLPQVRENIMEDVDPFRSKISTAQAAAPNV